MRTYWLVERTNDALNNCNNLSNNLQRGNSEDVTRTNGFSPDLNESKQTKDYNKLKKNSVHDISDTEKDSFADVKRISGGEMQGSNFNEIYVSVYDHSQSGETTNVTMVPAPDLLPKVHFETKM